MAVDLCSALRDYFITFEMSRNATENGQVLDLALDSRVVRRNTASRVLLPFLNPNCSSPSIPFSSYSSATNSECDTSQVKIRRLHPSVPPAQPDKFKLSVTEKENPKCANS